MIIVIVCGGGSIKEKIRVECLNDIYKELVAIVGLENMEKIYDIYRGQEVNFPLRLYNSDYIRTIISEEYNGTNSREIARKTGYSERWIKKLINENKK